MPADNVLALADELAADCGVDDALRSMFAVDSGEKAELDYLLRQWARRHLSGMRRIVTGGWRLLVVNEQDLAQHPDRW